MIVEVVHRPNVVDDPGTWTCSSGRKPGWQAVCSCGWDRPPRRAARGALMDVNDHRRGVIRRAREKGWPMRPGPGLAVTVLERQADTPSSAEVPSRAAAGL